MVSQSWGSGLAHLVSLGCGFARDRRIVRCGLAQEASLVSMQ